MKRRWLRWLSVLALSVVGSLVIWRVSAVFDGSGSRHVNLLRAGLTAGVIVLLVAAQYVAAKRAWIRPALVGAVGCIVLVAAVSTVETGIQRYFGQARQTATWSFFHYYLGSKYFKELGYDGLYEEMLKADHQGKQRLSRAKYYRDMHTYNMVPTKKVRAQPRREAFTEQRWREFKRDVKVITGFESKRFWRYPTRDRGYNPPPGWALIGGTLAKLFDPASDLQMTAMLLLEPVLLLLAFAYSITAYGLWRSLLVLAGSALWIGGHRLFGGKLLQYDWFAASWAALACMKRGHWLIAGPLIAYAASVRIFPGVLLLGPGFQGLWLVFKKRQWPRHIVKLIASAGVALAVLMVLSGLASGRGLSSWVEFTDSIKEHNEHHKYTETRIGLPFLTTASLDSGISEKVSRQKRKRIYEENKVLRVAVQLVLLGLLALAARKEDTHDLAALSLVALFALTVSSRYYGVAYALLLLLHLQHLNPEPERRPWRYLGLDIGFFLVVLLPYFAELNGEKGRVVYMLLSMGLLTHLTACLLVGSIGKAPPSPAVVPTALPTAQLSSGGAEG